MKKIFLALALLCAVPPCFAKLRVRRDSFGRCTCTIWWDDQYRNGPDNTNWAKDRDNGRIRNGWDSEIVTVILCRNDDGEDERYEIRLYESSDYCVVWLLSSIGDHSEKDWDEKYYNYNAAKLHYDGFVETCKLACSGFY